MKRMKAIAAALSAALMATTMVGIIGRGATSAAAETSVKELTSAVTKVDQLETEPSRYDRITVNIGWTAPADADQGDFFRVQLPREYVVPDGLTFDLTDSTNGIILGSGTTSNSEVRAEFSRSSAYLQGSSGSIKLRLYFDTTIVEAGNTYTPEFTTSSGPFTDSFVARTYDLKDPNATYTFLGKTTQTDETRALQWGITGPPIANPYAGNTYRFIFDRTTSNYDPTCAGAYMVMGDGFSKDGGLVNENHRDLKYPPSSDFSVECLGTRMIVTLKDSAQAKYAGLIPGARGYAKPVGTLSGTYSYQATMTIGSIYDRQVLGGYKAPAATATASTPQPSGTATTSTSAPSSTATASTAEPSPATSTTESSASTSPTPPTPSSPDAETLQPPTPDVFAPDPTTAPQPPTPEATTSPSPTPTARPTSPNPVTPTPSGPTPPVSTPTAGPGPGPRPRATKRLMFQVDTYDVRRKTDRRALARILADRRLGYREDRRFWGRSSWEFVTVTVSAEASPAAIRRAVNRATRTQPDVTTTSTSIPGTRRRVTIAWGLAAGAGRTAPWGPRHNVPQQFVARGRRDAGTTAGPSWAPSLAVDLTRDPQCGWVGHAAEHACHRTT